MNSETISLNFDIKIDIGNLSLHIYKLKYIPSERFVHYSNHYHSGYELHYVPSGNGKLKIGDSSFEILPGTLYLTGPNIYHEQTPDACDPMAEYCIQFEVFKKEKNNDKYTSKDLLMIEKTLYLTSFWFGTDKYDSINLLKRIFEETSEKYIGFYDNIKNYMKIIITDTVRCFITDSVSFDTPPGMDRNDTRRLIVDEYIQNNWKSGSLSQLAEILGVSKRQLQRIFAEYYGSSFNEKQVQIRMKHAAELLENTNLTVSQIAEQSGYNGVYYFCKAFKKSYKITATEYRDMICSYNLKYSK